jgi:hypothetical protein
LTSRIAAGEFRLSVIGHRGALAAVGGPMGVPVLEAAEEPS